MRNLSAIGGVMLLTIGLSGCVYNPAPYSAYGYGYGPRYSYIPPSNYAYGSYGYGPSVSTVYVAPAYAYPVVRPAPVVVGVGLGWGGGHGGWHGEHRGDGWGRGHFHGH